ncbi:MAG: methyltransferase domain-containing protein [Desulfosalsimonas sp.]|uniref:class I SAM-dependent methyltransferase n=1 Tax=Desulfosalsimonas sp. TaxID=3073848 RepID=UPI003970DFBA
MKHWVAEKLICPDCLPEEYALKTQISREAKDDIIDGKLHCPGCRRSYPVQDGIANLRPEKTPRVKSANNGYNAPVMLSAYMWSHFGDLLADARATDAYRVWSQSFVPTSGDALDVGCAVGRLSFELSKTHDRVIGIDTSFAFIVKAREIVREKNLDFELVVEGNLTEHRQVAFDNGWHFENVDFIVADALALPFAGRDFSGVAAINVLEKVPDPLKHLEEVNRVLRPEDAMFLFSDPFSWDPAFSAPERWLGGSRNGSSPYSKRGIDTIRRMFAGEFGVFDPPFEIADQGDVSWKIRKTENLWEQITSQFLVGCRKSD